MSTYMRDKPDNRDCPRCDGLMLPEWDRQGHQDPGTYLDTLTIAITTLECINCGYSQTVTMVQYATPALYRDALLTA